MDTVVEKPRNGLRVPNSRLLNCSPKREAERNERSPSTTHEDT